MSPLVISATFLAGLAFFFFGLDLVKNGLKSLANRRFRKISGRMVSSGPLAACWGVVFGAATQSATAVAFLLVGLVSAGLLPLSRALVTVSWANVGTSVLVFIAAIDLRLVSLFLVAATGLLLGLGKAGRWEPLLRTGLGVGLLFLGLKFMKDSIEPLTQEPWFETVASSLNEFLLAGYVAGAVLRIVIQSSSGIIIVLITLAAHGVLSLDQTLMCIHGTGAGVGATILLLGSNLEGNARQIALYQAVINVAASVFLASWMLLSECRAVGGLAGLLQIISDRSIQETLASGYAVQMVLCALIGTALLPGAPAWLARLAPPSVQQTLSQPCFLDENALETPDVALELVEQEQQRVLSSLPGLLSDVRADRPTEGPRDVKPSVLRAALVHLNAEITAYLSDLMAKEGSREVRHRILAAAERQRCLDQLAESLADLAVAAGPLCTAGETSALAVSLIEGVDTIIGVAIEASRGTDPMDSEVLAAMTSDRGHLLERARHSIVHRPPSTDASAAWQEAALLYGLSLFERTVWLVRQLRL